MNSRELNKVVFAVLLLDTLGMFEWVDGSYKWDISRIMHNLDCCSCAIEWDKYNVSTPFFVIGEWNSQVAPHTHIINDIIGLRAQLDELSQRITKVNAKANAGL